MIAANVLFPLPFGPITACTSPALTVKSRPLRMSRPSTPACRFLISNIVKIPLTDAAFQTHPEKLLRFDGKFHGQFLEYLLAKPVHDHVHRVLRGQPSLVAVKNLVLADFRCGRLVLHAGGG